MMRSGASKTNSSPTISVIQNQLNYGPMSPPRLSNISDLIKMMFHGILQKNKVLYLFICFVIV